MKITIKDINLKGKKVLVRVDYNVPLDEKGQITNDKRIVATLPTIKYILEQNASIILMSHLGRPKGKVDPKMSLKPAAKRLSELLGKEVKIAPDCVGEEVKKTAVQLKNGEVLLLENLRFHPEEEKNDDKFSKELASLGEVFVQDAFGSVHRPHASTAGIAKYIKIKAAGFLLEKEIKFLGDELKNPKQPYLAILGGAKVSDKISIIENLMNKVNSLIIGGGMAYTFLLAKGISIGNSLLEPDKIETAKKIMQIALDKKIRLFLPLDHVIVDKIDFANKKVDASGVIKTTEGAEIPDGFIGVDIGPMTIARIAPVILEAKTIVWNGPMGVFEIDEFSKGTIEIAKLVAQSTEKGAVSVIGGGDSISAVKKAGVDKKITHISTGGGASLEYLEGKELPGIAVLPDK
ncbi:MAG: phosphoglycerate kinase [Elusimicrobia bacterium]|nr:phosphoglycerate kinase [Candidatus Liberimonas magnetica]